MATTARRARSAQMILRTETAADLMRANPVSIRENATVQEAVTLLTDKGFSAAPVIDASGHPVGVVSRSDVLVHDRERVEYLPPVPDYYAEEELARSCGKKEASGFQVVNVDRTGVREIMTPVVFSVRPETPAWKVVEEMLALKVHRLFVVDTNEVLIGVISATDVLKHLVR
jgi:CBS domain-containing protein